MFKKLKRNPAQIFSEYAITLMVVVGAITAMSIFLQRGLQSRIWGARRYMFNVISQDNPDIPLRQQYEPYYVESSSNILRASAKQVTLRVDSESRYHKDTGDFFNIDTFSIQAPASEASGP